MRAMRPPRQREFRSRSRSELPLPLGEGWGEGFSREKDNPILSLFLALLRLNEK